MLLRATSNALSKRPGTADDFADAIGFAARND
jgi:hypothetical protein